MAAISILADSTKSIASVINVVWHQKSNLKSIDENDSQDIAFTRGIYSLYLKSWMAAILFLADGPKSIAPVLYVVWHQKSDLKSIGEPIIKISRSQEVFIAYA